MLEKSYERSLLGGALSHPFAMELRMDGAPGAGLETRTTSDLEVGATFDCGVQYAR